MNGKRHMASRFGLCASIVAIVGCTTAVPHAGTEAPRIELLGADAEVWAFRTRVDGVLHGAGTLKACTIERDGQMQPAVVARTSFRAEVELVAGRNQLKARCRTEEGRDLLSQPLRYEVRLRAGPIARAKVEHEGGRVQLAASESSVSESVPAPIVRYVWSRVDGTLAGEGERVELPAGEPAGARYRLEVTDALGRSDRAEVRASPTTEWLDHSVGYGVLPPQFGPRALSDVIVALEDLAELGVNALWLAPAFVAAEGDYGYAVVDYFTVRSDYGTREDLAALVRAAHRLGLRVLLDLPANHTSVDHPYYRQTVDLRARSHYYTFYDRDASGEATHYFDWTHLPNLNYSEPEVARFIREVGRHWVSELDVDGYRIDAAWGVRQRSPDYWPSFRRELERVEPDVILLAEASARDPYYLDHGFDLAYDWTTELGHHAWEHVFTERTGIAQRLHAAVAASSGDPRRVLRFLNNNDTGKRFITRHGEPLTRVATAALLTLPGLPCLYTYDEIGAEFEPYEEQPAVRVDRPGLREFHQRFIHLRRTRAALAGSFEALHIGKDDELYAYLRRAGDDVLLLVLNFAEQASELSLPLPLASWPSQRARDALTGEHVALSKRRLRLRVPGFSVRVFEAR